MFEKAYRYRFAEGVDFDQVKLLLLMSMAAAEGLFGEAQVHMDAASSCHPGLRQIIVDAGTDVGEDINRIFVALLTRVFGYAKFDVRPVEQPMFLCTFRSQEAVA